MRQENRRTPAVFRLGILLLGALLISSHMLSGLYARYFTTVTATSGARVAEISCTITPELTNESLFLSSHPLDVNKVPADCGAVAVAERFTLYNDGEVSYEYILSLSLAEKETGSTSAYSLISLSDKAWVPSSDGRDGAVQSFTVGAFHYYEGDTQVTAISPILSGRLAVGASVTYTVVYFIDLQNASFNQQQMLLYDITCTQIN